MRRTGKTTRAVDEAIQSLFEVGGILVPKNNQRKPSEIRGIHDLEIIVDPDYDLGTGQKNMAKILLDRLHREHRHAVDIFDHPHYYIIKLKGGKSKFDMEEV